jgi:hypothetical protein
MDLRAICPDLIVPPVSNGPPTPGKRVRQTDPDYAGTAVHHLLYLPHDWKKGQKYPLIVEYAGNHWRTSPGTVTGSNLGYGMSGGAGAIWLCLPFVDTENGTNATTWWGQIQATVDYCIKTVLQVCHQYGGDDAAVFFTGFSRGAIAGNFIGLHNDRIAALWRGFVCHSHYDGVQEWPYPGSDKSAAAQRLARLGDRPQFISHESDVSATQTYLGKACPAGDFTFVALPFADHTDTWVLRDIAPRRILRAWFEKNRR